NSLRDFGLWGLSSASHRVSTLTPPFLVWPLLFTNQNPVSVAMKNSSTRPSNSGLKQFGLKPSVPQQPTRREFVTQLLRIGSIGGTAKLTTLPMRSSLNSSRQKSSEDT